MQPPKEEEKIPEKILPGAPAARPRATPNLQGILKGGKPELKITEEVKSVPLPAKPVQEKELRAAWAEFAAQRKNQAAEYQLLRRDIEVNGTQVAVVLTNPVEEPLLDSIRPLLHTYLREKLDNAGITVTGILKEQGSKKVIYTNKEKFEHLAEKNPLLLDLKERLGLDPDF